MDSAGVECPVKQNSTLCNGQTLIVHCPEEECIGNTLPRGQRYFPRAGILHSKAQGPMPSGAISPPELNLSRSSGECIKKYCPKGNITQYTPKGAESVFDNMVPVDHII